MNDGHLGVLGLMLLGHEALMLGSVEEAALLVLLAAAAGTRIIAAYAFEDGVVGRNLGRELSL
jgi:hypothetical protein